MDEFRVREDFSQPVALKATNPTMIKLENSTILGDCLFVGDSIQMDLTTSDIEGVYIEGEAPVLEANSSVLHKVDMAYSQSSISLNSSFISDETGTVFIWALNLHSQVITHQSRVVVDRQLQSALTAS